MWNSTRTANTVKIGFYYPLSKALTFMLLQPSSTLTSKVELLYGLIIRCLGSSVFFALARFFSTLFLMDVALCCKINKNVSFSRQNNLSYCLWQKFLIFVPIEENEIFWTLWCSLLILNSFPSLVVDVWPHFSNLPIVISKVTLISLILSRT